MHVTPHAEKHFQSSDVVRDIVIGMSDGLTVPFALAAGLTGAVDASHIIVVAGLAEIAAGSIAMGLGGYLAARSEEDHYASEHRREEREIAERVEDERHEAHAILESYGLDREARDHIVGALERNPAKWADWMMRFELGLEKPKPGRAVRSASAIAFSYVAGGLIPLIPYLITPQSQLALRYSVVATILALAVFGYGKGHFTGVNPAKSAARTTLIGGLAAGVAYSIAKLFTA